MTAIVKIRQVRQARVRRSLETTPLSIFYWLDDFINHQPSDELVERDGIFLNEID